MKIKTLKKKNLSFANEIAYLHVENINGKLANIGVELLTKIYHTFILDKNIKIWVLLNGEKVIGFLCACANNEKIYINFLLNNFNFLFFFFTKNIFNLFILKNIYGLIILILSSDKKKKLCNSELLSIAISKKYRNKSYGRKLIRNMDIYFKKKHKREYIVKVEAKNRKAIDFYLSNKFKPIFKAQYPLFETFYLKKKLF